MKILSVLILFFASNVMAEDMLMTICECGNYTYDSQNVKMSLYETNVKVDCSTLTVINDMGSRVKYEFSSQAFVPASTFYLAGGPPADARAMCESARDGYIGSFCVADDSSETIESYCKKGKQN